MVDDNACNDLLATGTGKVEEVNISDPVIEVLYIVEPTDNENSITFPVEGAKVIVRN